MSTTRIRALERYSLHMGRLMERHLSETALIAARQAAEREAAAAIQAKLEIEAATDALHNEMAIRQQTQSRLAYLATHDPLTDLPNRSYFNERLTSELEKAQRRGRKLALLYIDLDNFKDVNDTLGHAVGDELLREFSSRVLTVLRGGDTIARIGGDEFALLQPDPEDAADAGELGERVIAALAEPFVIAGRPMFIGASIGITMFPDDAANVALLHRNADLAMYRAKADGRNRCHFFDETLNQEVHHRAMLEQALREPALLTQLEIVYQPQFDLRANRISGVEALLRWHHPERGIIPPDEFIPVAERSGLIVDIGTWVLRECCRQAVRWRQAGLPALTMSVNVSTVQFRVSDMPALVAEILAETGLPGHCLELEITETGIMHDVHVAADMLMALHRLGVGLAIDDFGTGYSSLSYLRRVPVDRLKIDRSFINDVTTNADAAAVATTIVQLAHSLRLQVVAEGVETPAQADFIRQTGCAFVQGFFFARPLRAGQIAELLVRMAPAVAS
jgi:diguanylate cyclase (GGDEF)-like protein